MKKICTFLVVLLLFVISLPMSAFAETDGKDIRNYVIKSYEVNVGVSENNVLHVEEVIVAEFRSLSTGFERTIPLKGNVAYADSNGEKLNAKIDNIDVKNETFTTENTDGNSVIKIGYDGEKLLGQHIYEISYDYNLGRDKSSDFDMLHLNVVDTKWNVPIEHASFTVTMPKEFDAEKLEVLTGSFGNLGTASVQYSVSGNIISGGTDGMLKPTEALTISLELPNGYFETNTAMYVAIAVVAVVIIAAVVFIVIKRKKK